MAFVEVDVDTTDYDKKIGKLKQDLPAIPYRVMGDIAQYVEDVMKDVAPVKTGYMRDSINHVVYTSDSVTGEGSAAASVQTNSGYGKYVDQDTKPHDIIGNPWLVFEIDGITYFRHQVHHPGTKGKQFTRRTIREASGGIMDILRQNLADAMAEIDRS